MSKIKKTDLLKLVQEQAEMIAELSAMVELNKMSIIKLENEREKPQLKQLDQSVFKEWADCWKFFAIDEYGDAWRYREKPKIDNGDNRWSPSNTAPLLIGKGYDASNWQDSLIERDTAKELLEVDLSSELTGSELCKAMLARGDKYVMCLVGTHNDAVVIEGMHGNEFVAVGMRNLYRNPKPINNQGEPLTASEVGL